MNNLNAVEFAIKVTSFRKMVRQICAKKGLEYPSDEKIAEWIDQKYGFNVDDFIKDYTEKEGIFREPITDFINEVNKIGWLKKPTEDEIKEFFEKNGNNIGLFCQQRTIAALNPLERDLLLATLKLADFQLVKLWNLFVEESGLYGADSYIYDLRDKADVDFINKNFPNDRHITRILVTQPHSKFRVRELHPPYYICEKLWETGDEEIPVLGGGVFIHEDEAIPYDESFDGKVINKKKII